jgi:hypothetical protein
MIKIEFLTQNWKEENFIKLNNINMSMEQQVHLIKPMHL